MGGNIIQYTKYREKALIIKIFINIVVVFILSLAGMLYSAETEIADYRSYLKRFTTPLLTGETLWVSPQLFVELSAGDSIEFNVESKKEGFWNIRLEYQILSNQVLPPEVSITINGKLPFKEAQSIPLIQYWIYSDLNFPKNRYGDEIVPGQNIAKSTISFTLRNPTGIDKHPLWFKIDVPNTTINLTLQSGKILLKRVYLEQPVNPKSYIIPASDYTQSLRKPIVIQAEKPYLKSEPSINAIAIRSPEVVPYTTYNLLLNAFGGDNWKQPGQSVSYIFDVPEDGYYKIALKYLQNSRPNFTSYRTVYVDDKMLYRDLIEVPFEYSQNWKIRTLKSADKSQDLLFYLTKGTHKISLEVNASMYSDALYKLKSIINYINELSLQIKYITGGKFDKNVEWEIRDYFPDIESELETLIKEIDDIKKSILETNGNALNSEYVSLNLAQMLLKRLVSDVNKIPNRLEVLTGSTGSVLSELSSVYSGLQQMPLVLDEIYIYQGKSIDRIIKVSPLTIFLEGFKRFFNSFVPTKYSDYRNAQSENAVVLKVWVNRSRQYVDILQQLIDKEFTPKTGIYVDVSIMRDEGKLILANAAKKSPDVALSISNWIPFEMGIRGAALDLRRFSDFVDVSKNFYPGSLLPYLYEEHCYGLPETLDFYVLFYRKDITDYLGINIPTTWDDVKLILPELQRNGMNFYIPLGGSTSFKAWMTTAPFIMQYHGKLFTADGLKTAIDNPSTLKAFKEMTELFTMYGMPAQVANFFESFRKGEIPIGVGNLSTYVQLTIAAPELRGLWNMAPSPGVKYNGTIERWQTGSAQAVAILNDTKYPMEAWEFVKWWLSKETQMNFVNQVVSTYGIEFLTIPSNRYAIDGLPLRFSDLEVVKEQFKWLQEVPKMPASYILEREISNIWNKVVLEGRPLRVAVDDSVQVINKEFARKLEEFGYYKDGEPVRPFKIYSLNDIMKWYKDTVNK
ncbi:extracellular solute-binding protein [Fervidobacterium sp.]